jgi:hypothetical protein
LSPLPRLLNDQFFLLRHLALEFALLRQEAPFFLFPLLPLHQEVLAYLFIVNLNDQSDVPIGYTGFNLGFRQELVYVNSLNIKTGRLQVDGGVGKDVHDLLRTAALLEQVDDVAEEHQLGGWGRDVQDLLELVHGLLERLKGFHV